MPVPAHTCKGYVLASQHPSTPTTAAHDPYAIVPCPHPPTIPAVLSAGCAASNRKRSCKQGVYCEMHHCGGCKRACKAAQPGKNLDGKAVKVTVAVAGEPAQAIHALADQHELW